MADYPSKASLIIYKNGPSLELNAQGMPYLPSTDLDRTPYYTEVELNSPLAVLGPGESYTFDTTWFPSRLSREFNTVTEAGMVGRPLSAHRSSDRIELSGDFGVFYAGELRAYLYDEGGFGRGEMTLRTVRPQDRIVLKQSIAADKRIVRVSIHLIDSNGLDRGALGEGFVTIDDEGR